MKPQVACIMSLTFLTFTLHLIDRQAEYLRKLDFKWKVQLASEQTEAQKMHKINNMLLSNILPIHVGKLIKIKIFSIHKTDMIWFKYHIL